MPLMQGWIAGNGNLCLCIEIFLKICVECRILNRNGFFLLNIYSSIRFTTKKLAIWTTFVYI